MCKNCDWEEKLDELNEILDDEDYEFAYDSLSGIAKWVEENHHITERQELAVENIRQAVEKRNK